MVTKHIQITQITEDKDRLLSRRSQVIGTIHEYPLPCRESLGSGFDPHAAHKIDLAIGLRL